MNQLRITMQQFFGSFHNLPGQTPDFLPAFPQSFAVTRDAKGNPISPPFPYITYPLIKQGFGAQTIVAASVWNRVEGYPGHFGLVDWVLGQFEGRFKGGRIVLTLDDGSGGVILQFDRCFWMGDPSDRLVTQGIMQMAIKDFIP